MYKTIERDGREWLWPEYDTELIKVFDQVRDLDAIMDYVDGDGVCVQAGGACGVWPNRLCVKFARRVYTFEPDPLNYTCLVRNTRGLIALKGLTALRGLEAFNAALGASNGWCHISRDESEKTNAGAGYTVSGGDIPVVTIDGLFLHELDLIVLDVEGREADALLGGFYTIHECRPTIVIEEKPLPQLGIDHTKARRLLESWGYKERARVHRDVIFTHD